MYIISTFNTSAMIGTETWLEFIKTIICGQEGNKLSEDYFSMIFLINWKLEMAL